MLKISHISPDPAASTSTFITPSPNISTMRIFLQNVFINSRIAQDSQEKPVLNVVGAEMEDIDLKILKDTSTTTSPTEDETIPLREPQSSGPSQPTSSRNLDQYLGIEESKMCFRLHTRSAYLLAKAKK